MKNKEMRRNCRQEQICNGCSLSSRGGGRFRSRRKGLLAAAAGGGAWLSPSKTAEEEESESLRVVRTSAPSAFLPPFFSVRLRRRSDREFPPLEARRPAETPRRGSKEAWSSRSPDRVTGAAEGQDSTVLLFWLLL